MINDAIAKMSFLENQAAVTTISIPNWCWDIIGLMVASFNHRQQFQVLQLSSGATTFGPNNVIFW